MKSSESIDEIIPAIISKWPHGDWNSRATIKIQQDGAPAHQAFAKDNWEQVVHDLYVEDKLELITQPPNSPDTNVLDLGFFRSLQAQYYLNNPKTQLDIIKFVRQAFDEYNPTILNRIWLSYQACLDEILKIDGDNDYILPHLNKQRLEQQNALPFVLPVTADVSKWI